MKEQKSNLIEFENYLKMKNRFAIMFGFGLFIFLLTTFVGLILLLKFILP